MGAISSRKEILSTGEALLACALPTITSGSRKMLAALAPEIAPTSSEPQPLRISGLTIYTLGLLMAIVARLQLGRNWSDIEKSRVKRDQILVAHGLYRWVRHPIYAGDLLLLLGLELALNSWAVAGVVVLALYVRQQATREERALAESCPVMKIIAAALRDSCRAFPIYSGSSRSIQAHTG